MNTADNTATAQSTPPAVTILLSTFNGGAFLQQQLDSLYQQTHPNIRIVARDDGSSDETRSILEREHAAKRIELLAGNENLGAALSFFELLRHAAMTNTDFVAFCDQDDVWLPDKISQAVSVLSAVHNERAAMYCSRLEVVNANMAPVSFTPLPNRIGFGNALVENVCVGCTIVLNRQAIDLVCLNQPTKVLVHDWWCYLVLSCFGEVIFDPDAHIKYRQHAGNAFGVARNSWDRLGRNLRRFAGRGDGRHWQSEQALVFLSAFGDRIPLSQRRVLHSFVDAKSTWSRRVALAFSNVIWRQKGIDSFFWRILVLLNRY